MTASFQVILPPDAPVQNITFGFGDPMGIAYIDLDGQFGSGSLELANRHNMFDQAIRFP